MKVNNKVDILGTTYDVVVLPHDEGVLAENTASGLCDCFRKTIYLSEMDDLEPENVDEAQREILRHEIIHAFLNESGLGANALAFDGAWPMNEEMVDWFALMLPKVYKVFREMDLIGG